MFEFWDGLTIKERDRIAREALERYKKSNETTCIWCGSPLPTGGKIAVTTKGYRICVGSCSRQRYFDDPMKEEE